MMRCMYCGHSKVHKRGKTKRGETDYQRYLCDRCHKSYTELTGTIYEDRRLTPIEIDRILECQKQGMNFAQAAKKVGVSAKAVSNLLKATEQGAGQPTDSVQSVEHVREASDREAHQQEGRQTPSIVERINNYQIILFAALFGISGCLIPATNQHTASTLNPTNTASANLNSGSILLADKYKRDVDIYEIKYSWCDNYCADRQKRAAVVDTIVTWGKPTEIGFMYSKEIYPQFKKINPLRKITYNGMTITGLSAQIVIKSRGLVPPLKKPLATAKFTPVKTVTPMFFPEKFNAPLIAEAKGSVRTSTLKILALRKLSPTEANVYVKKAENPQNLATIGAIEESLYGEIQKLAAYYEFYKDKPDIEPQQVEKISERVNVTPQVIQVKKW